MTDASNSNGLRGTSRYSRRCVKMLAEDAAYFHRMIAGSSTHDAVLRAVFVVDTMSDSPLLRRAQAVSLRNLNPDFAKSLDQLKQTCNSKRQLVGWFTVENENGLLLDHGTVILDKDEDEPLWEGIIHQPPSQEDRLADALETSEMQLERASRIDSRYSPEIDVKDSVANMRKELRELSRASATSRSRVSPGRGSRKGDRRPSSPRQQSVQILDQQQPFSASNNSPAPWSQPLVRRAQQMGGSSSPVPEEAAQDVTREDVNDMMNVLLLVSRATAKIATSMDDAHRRLDKLYDIVSLAVASMKPPSEVNEKILYRLDEMSTRLSTLESTLQQERSSGASSSHTPSRVRTYHVSTQVGESDTCARSTQTEWFDVPNQRPYVQPPSLPARSAVHVDLSLTDPIREALSAGPPSASGRIVEAIPIVAPERGFDAVQHYGSPREISSPGHSTFVSRQNSNHGSVNGEDSLNASGRGRHYDAGSGPAEVRMMVQGEYHQDFNPAGGQAGGGAFTATVGSYRQPAPDMVEPPHLRDRFSSTSSEGAFGNTSRNWTTQNRSPGSSSYATSPGLPPGGRSPPSDQLSSAQIARRRKVFDDRERMESGPSSGMNLHPSPRGQGVRGPPRLK